jgi:phenylacetate-CoA ligase
VEAQIVQKALGNIVIRIVRRVAYGEKDEKLLLKEVGSKISPNLSVTFEYVDHIERETTGKFRAVKSFVKKN